jgi:hypothetical protein
MPTDDHDHTRPDLTPTWVPTLAAAKPDCATYEASRRAELDRIRLIDIKRRQLLGYFCPLESMRLTTFGMMKIFPCMKRRSTIRQSLSCISATESWSTRSKDTCWGA